MDAPMLEATPSSSDWWCDPQFGWGPFVEDTHTLTICFCSTVFELPPPLLLALLGVPSLLKLSKEPFVNPASSITFSFKLGLSAVALLCCMLLAMFSLPASPANTWAQSLTAAGWLLSILMLVAGYLRAQPQLYLLRLWWLAQFVSQAVVFGNHSTLDPPPGAHMIRGVSLLCSALLVFLSFYTRDVPTYEAIIAPPSGSGSMSSFRSPSTRQLINGSTASVTTPLLMPRMDLNESSPSTSMPVAAGQNRYGLVSQLSQMTLYGADTSVFKGAISAWDEAVSSSYKAQQQNGLVSIADEDDESAHYENGNGNANGKKSDGGAGRHDEDK